jgi:hypothetical protein
MLRFLFFFVRPTLCALIHNKKQKRIAWEFNGVSSTIKKNHDSKAPPPSVCSSVYPSHTHTCSLSARLDNGIEPNGITHEKGEHVHMPFAHRQQQQNIQQG